MAKRVKAFAPATVANLGVGFDVLGMAVTEPGDYVTIEKRPQPGIEIVSITGDEGNLSTDPQKNTAAIAVQSFLKMMGTKEGVRLWIEKGLPLASGLGSSAASAVAAVFAANELFDNPLSREELLPATLDAEEAVSGRHADNVAPSLLGGIILITGLSPAQIHRLPVPAGIYLSLITPDSAISTADARAILPDSISLQTLVHQTGVVAELVHALHMGNIHLLAMAMQRDSVVERARTTLVPHFQKARAAAASAGALCTIISGSGPTICSFCVTRQDAEVVHRTLLDLYIEHGPGAEGWLVTPSAEGAKIVED